MSTKENGGAVHTPAHLDCEQWGVGGQYVVDPATGKRTRVGGPLLPGQAESAASTAVADQVAAVPDVAKGNTQEESFQANQSINQKKEVKRG